MEDIVIKGRYIKKSLIILNFVVMALLVFIIIFQYYNPRDIDTDTSSIPEEAKKETENKKEIETKEKQESSDEKNTEENDDEYVQQGKTAADILKEMEQGASLEELEQELADEDLEGTISLEIKDIGYEIKAEDYAKVTNITIMIDNQLKTFAPIIKAYLYDNNDDDDIKNYVEEDIQLKKIYGGASEEKMLEVGISYNEIDLKKTLKLELYDDDTLLKTATKSFDTEE